MIKVNLETKIILRKVNSALDDCDLIANLTLSSIYKIYNIRTSVKELHSNFIFVLIDKAANNVAITCKKLYALVITKKLGFNSGNSNNENGTCDKTISIVGNDIINRHYL